MRTMPTTDRQLPYCNTLSFQPLISQNSCVTRSKGQRIAPDRSSLYPFLTQLVLYNINSTMCLAGFEYIIVLWYSDVPLHIKVDLLS
jgi:hypothetical protein